jgi:internalin A
MRIVALIVALGLLACDEDKKPEVAPKPSATPAAAQTTALPASTTSAAPVEVAKKKEPTVCADGPLLKTDDAVLEGQIRIKLAKKPGDAIKVSELPNVRSVNLTESKKLSELDPCVMPKLTGLHHLYVGPGEYEDLNPIAGLIHLETLRISISKVKDLTPIARMTMLDRLDLGRTPVRDLKPLEGLVNITELSLDDTQITDIAPLAALKKLEKLSLRNTQVTDLSALAGIKTLKTLDVTGTSMSSFGALSAQVARGLKIKN